MKNGRSVEWFRVFALCLAIGLGATFVWTQQNHAAPAKSRSVLESNSPPPADGNLVKPEVALMPGSKSTSNIIVLDQRKPNDPPLPGWDRMENKDRTLMPGSKSAIFVEPKDRILMPGSKSLVIPPPIPPVAEP